MNAACLSDPIRHSPLQDFQQGPGPLVAEGATSCSQLVARGGLWGTGLIAAGQLPPAVGGRWRTNKCLLETIKSAPVLSLFDVQFLFFYLSGNTVALKGGVVDEYIYILYI